MIQTRLSADAGRASASALAVPSAASLSHIDLAPSDLELIARVASMRLDEPEGELSRVALVDRIRHKAHEVARLLHVWQTQVIVECRGTRSARDLSTTNRLYVETLAEYAAMVREVADSMRRLVAMNGATAELES